MATSTFWADHNAVPNQKFRWLLHLGNMTDHVPVWVVQTTDKPKYTGAEVEVPFLNHTFKFPGRAKWEDIKVTIVSQLNPDVSRGLLDAIHGGGYVYPSTLEVAQSMSISKARAVNALGRVMLEQLAPMGMGQDGPVETWTLKNAWIKDVDFGALDYKSEDVVEISMTLVFDWAERGSASATPLMGAIAGVVGLSI